MADDRTRGYNDGHRRPRPQAARGADDPLAELARLIGQQNESAAGYPPNSASELYPGGSDADGGWATPDPYGQRGGMQDPGASQWAPDSPAMTPAAYDSSHAGYGNGQYDPRQYDPRQYDPRNADPRYGGSQDTEPQYVDPQYADQRYPDSRQGSESQDSRSAANQPYTDQAYADPRYGDPRYSDPRYAADPRYSDQHYSDQQYDPRYGDAAPVGYADPRYGDAAGNGYADPRYAEPHLGGAPSQYGTPSYAPPPASDQGYAGYGYQDGGQSYGNSYYGAPPVPGMVPAADARQPAQRRSIVTVLAVLALAVVGTASAFGYRAMFGGGGTAVPPPVITADTRPSKVVPATDPNAKPIQDRIGVKTEKVVPRQEEPVQQAAPGQPRQIAPWLPAQNPQNFPPASANVSPPTGSTGVGALQGQPSAAPKRIKTVPIKPEQGADASRNARSAAAAPAAQPDDPIAAQISGAPLALSPAGSVPANRQGAAPTVTASLPQSTGALPFPTPISGGGSRAPVASANPVSGPYAVQVTSQRSESDAQASFRSLQQQFPSVLGSRQPVIRRADLGEKGTYYRAQIPFQSQSEASEFCSSLKAAGGQCVIARN